MKPQILIRCLCCREVLPVTIGEEYCPACKRKIDPRLLDRELHAGLRELEVRR